MIVKVRSEKKTDSRSADEKKSGWEVQTGGITHSCRPGVHKMGRHQKLVHLIDLRNEQLRELGHLKGKVVRWAISFLYAVVLARLRRRDPARLNVEGRRRYLLGDSLPWLQETIHVLPQHLNGQTMLSIVVRHVLHHPVCFQCRF